MNYSSHRDVFVRLRHENRPAIPGFGDWKIVLMMLPRVGELDTPSNRLAISVRESIKLSRGDRHSKSVMEIQVLLSSRMYSTWI
jgi:hypothetical protein